MLFHDTGTLRACSIVLSDISPMDTTNVSLSLSDITSLLDPNYDSLYADRQRWRQWLRDIGISSFDEPALCGESDARRGRCRVISESLALKLRAADPEGTILFVHEVKPSGVSLFTLWTPFDWNESAYSTHYRKHCTKLWFAEFERVKVEAKLREESEIRTELWLEAITRRLKSICSWRLEHCAECIHDLWKASESNHASFRERILRVEELINKPIWLPYEKIITNGGTKPETPPNQEGPAGIPPSTPPGAEEYRPRGVESPSGGGGVILDLS